jgi:hypothetical protein
MNNNTVSVGMDTHKKSFSYLCYEPSGDLSPEDLYSFPLAIFHKNSYYTTDTVYLTATEKRYHATLHDYA